MSKTIAEEEAMSKTIDASRTWCACGHTMARHYPSALVGMDRGDAPACRDCPCRAFDMRDTSSPSPENPE